MASVDTSSHSTLDEVFLAAFKKNLPFEALSPDAKAFVQGLAKQQKSDFASPSGGYFSLESQEAISQKAAGDLTKALAGQAPASITVQTLQSEWQKIVTDFYRQNSWGFTTQKQKPPKVLTQDQKIAREIAPYIWAAFQAWVVMKIIIYYFGLDAANNPEESHFFLYLGMGFSFCSLVYFAWRKSKKGE